MQIRNKKLKKKMQGNMVFKDRKENPNCACSYDNAVRCMLCSTLGNAFLRSTFRCFHFSWLLTRWVAVEYFEPRSCFLQASTGATLRMHFAFRSRGKAGSAV